MSAAAPDAQPPAEPHDPAHLMYDADTGICCDCPRMVDPLATPVEAAFPAAMRAYQDTAEFTEAEDAEQVVMAILRAAFRAVVPASAALDAPDRWDVSVPPGGYVCSVCGTPVESEPCPDHQPRAYAGMNEPDDGLDVLDALIGDMACGLECGGNDDGNLTDYLARLRNVRALLASTPTSTEETGHA